jgi:hypothetical protein
MHVQQVLRSGPLVQIVDVLGYQQDLARPLGFQPGQCQMGRVWYHRAIEQRPPARIVKSVNALGIALKGLGRRDVFQAHLGPDTFRIAATIDLGIDVGLEFIDDLLAAATRWMIEQSRRAG